MCLTLERVLLELHMYHAHLWHKAIQGECQDCPNMEMFNEQNISAAGTDSLQGTVLNDFLVNLIHFALIHSNVWLILYLGICAKF